MLITPFPSRLVELFLCSQRRHFLVVSWSRVELADSADLVGGVSGNADVPVTLEDDLYVFDVEGVGTAELGHLACGGGDVVDEFVDELKDRLWRVVSGCGKGGWKGRGRVMDGDGAGEVWMNRAVGLRNT